MLKPYIEKLIKRQDLQFSETKDAIKLLLQGADPHQSAAFLALLRAKGETVEELFAMVSIFREKMVPIVLDRPVLDIVGTGGDGAGTVNISTGAALLAAACGVPIVKHGNRCSTSKCGSADVLEELGFDLEMDVSKSIQRDGFSFCFAPKYHPLFGKIKEIRKGLKISTCFNLLGPLLNPANAEYLVIGVNSEDLIEPFAKLLQKLRIKRSLIVHGQGIDELTPIGPAKVVKVTETEILPIPVDPKDFGFSRCKLKDLQGGDAKTNAELLKRAFIEKKGPIADCLILNAALALFIYEDKDFSQCLTKARKCLERSENFLTRFIYA